MHRERCTLDSCAQAMKMLEQVWLNADDTLRGVTELAQRNESQPRSGAF